MAEDILRESGYMLPQGSPARDFLQQLLDNVQSGFPQDAVEQLLAMLG